MYLLRRNKETVAFFFLSVGPKFISSGVERACQHGFFLHPKQYCELADVQRWEIYLALAGGNENPQGKPGLHSVCLSSV